ncbi:hypothetical protein VFPPC_16744 [Pochonia chlamydosporia 170]|uniref:Uncharacterized protein n=1 Tax=Pochonia chlamydosporia 170 TaxID=1380566 RepID=A0A179F5G4_METCM|nr:hypothetical protein VFPPC_16744 [Pochonia chlamydosporia 170]OAQ60581.1 hypothetical protein VFPPC_16744 [Pochonia chlamydosporia 170]
MFEIHMSSFGSCLGGQYNCTVCLASATERMPTIQSDLSQGIFKFLHSSYDRVGLCGKVPTLGHIL